jgi:hypothetical protein
MTPRPILSHGAAGAILTAMIVALTLATAYIHLTLGGLLFLLAGAGYAGLAVLIVVGARPPHPLVARFDWFPRTALAGYTAMTIVGYLVIGPYFALGWITKGIEVAIIVFLVADVLRVYGGLLPFVRRALASVGLIGPSQALPAGLTAAQGTREAG